jgi:hypothetical protein
LAACGELASVVGRIFGLAVDSRGLAGKNGFVRRVFKKVAAKPGLDPAKVLIILGLRWRAGRQEWLRSSVSDGPGGERADPCAGWRQGGPLLYHARWAGRSRGGGGVSLSFHREKILRWRGRRARGVGFGEAAGWRFNSVAFCEVIFRLLALDSVCAGVERFPVPLACRVSKSEQFPFSVCPLSPTSFGVRQCKQPVMANRNRRGSARPAAKNAVTGFGGRVHHPRRTTYRSDPTQHRFSGYRQRSGGLSGVVASKGGTRKPSCAVGSGNLSDAGGLDRS